MFSPCPPFSIMSALFCSCFHVVLSRTLWWWNTAYCPFFFLKWQCANFAPSTEPYKTTVTAPFVKPFLLQADTLFTYCGHYWCHLPNSGLWEQLADGGLVSAITITEPPYWLALEDWEDAGGRCSCAGTHLASATHVMPLPCLQCAKLLLASPTILHELTQAHCFILSS